MESLPGSPRVQVQATNSSEMKTMTQWRTVLIAAMAFLAVALLVSPVIAVKPAQRASWDGWGTTTTPPGWDPEVPWENVGIRVTFAGSAKQDASGTWSGKGTFAGTLDGAPLRARLDVTSGFMESRMYSESNHYDTLYVYGLATVTYRGTVYRDVPFSQNLYREVTDDGSILAQRYFLVLDWQGAQEVWIIAGDGRSIRGSWSIAP